MNPLIWQLAIAILLLTGIGVAFVYLLRKKSDLNRSLNFVFLQIMIPKKESKEDMERERDQTSEMRKVTGIGEHFFQTLYGIYSGEFSNRFTGEDFLSCEYVATKGEIKFYLGCPRYLKPLIEKQITSFYPEAVIDETESPKIFADNSKQATTYFSGTQKFFYPLKTYQKFETTDPINNILNALSNASDEKGNAAGVQIMFRPHKNGWTCR